AIGRAEAFVSTWQDALPFGRPLASLLSRGAVIFCIPADRFGRRSCKECERLHSLQRFRPFPVVPAPHWMKQAAGSGQEFFAEEVEDLVEGVAGRGSGFVLQVFGQHGVRARSVAVRVALRRIDLDADEVITECLTE